MSMYKRYEGSFLSLTGDTVRCEIWQEADRAFSQVGDLDFAGSNALTIEWPERAKHEVICGSTATLVLLSPGDRTYYDLFTVRPGTIRLDVYRAGNLYWSGALDPEQAEEPYTDGKNYYVNLLFSDFGILRRLNYNLTGMQDLQAILTDALTRSRVHYGSLSTVNVSTRIGQIQFTPQRIKVLSDNFYDEEGAPMTLYDVLEGVMQPLGLRMIQHGGTISLYDLNGIYENVQTQQIRWASEDQSLSVDRVYNEVKISFSPYAKDSLFPEFEYTGYDTLNEIQDDTSAIHPASCIFRTDFSEVEDESDQSFAITWSGVTAKGLAGKHGSAVYFNMIPILGGKAMSGVALWFYTARMSHGAIREQLNDARIGAATCPAATETVLRTEATYLPKLSAADAARFYIRLRQGILFDVRYNPFTEASQYNEKWEYKEIQTDTKTRLISVPVKVELKDAAGTVLYHYSNKSYRQSIDAGVASPGGVWVSGAAANDACELFYENPYSDGSGGPVSNRQARNVARKALSAALEAADPGEYIPYPPVAGYLVVTVLAGAKFYSFNDIHNYWYVYNYGVNNSNFSHYTPLTGRNNDYRWILFEAPDLSVVRSNFTGEPDNDDLEYGGTINPDAEESLEISEICGTMSPVSPGARGLLFTQDEEVLTELTRAGRTASPEQLLIGTMLSHHADRKDVLSGTAYLWGRSFTLLTDAALPGKLLLPVSLVEHLKEDEMEIRAVETVADEYITAEEDAA